MTYSKGSRIWPATSGIERDIMAARDMEDSEHLEWSTVVAGVLARAMEQDSPEAHSFAESEKLGQASLDMLRSRIKAREELRS